MKKHLRIFLACLCALLCCALLAGCTLTLPGAQPQSSTAPAAQQSSLVAFSSLAQNISEAGYYNILYTGDAEHTIYLLSLYDFSAKQHRILCDKEGCTHTDETCDAYLQASTLVARPGALYTICPRYFTDQADESGLADFVAMDAGGQNRRTLSAVSDGWDFFGIDKQYLYGFCEDAFGRISLADGTETYLLRNARSAFWLWGKVAGVWNGQFVTVQWGDDTRVDAIEIGLLSPEGAYTALGTVPAGRFLPYSGSVLLGGTLYYIDNSNGAVMGFSLENGETREVSRALCQYDRDEGSGFHACERWYLATAGGTLLAMVTGLDSESPWLSTPHQVNIATGAAQPLSLRQEYRSEEPGGVVFDGPGWNAVPDFVTPIAETPQGLFVACAYEFYTASYPGEDGQPVEYPGSRPVYALISPEDYLAGTPNFQEIQNLPLPA